jgi:pyruvate/2-oxoglutarate dehydrogenase complex dihydrolipoamide acyltransferase (E2) component
MKPRNCPDAVASPRGWVNPRTNALIVPHRNLSYKLRVFKDKCRQMGVDYNSLEGIAPVKPEPKPEPVSVKEPVSAPVETQEIDEIEEAPVEEVAKEAEPEETNQAEEVEPEVKEVKKSDKKVKVKITPAAKKAAEKFGIDINTVEGTGKDGQIIKTDIDKLIGV